MEAWGAGAFSAGGAVSSFGASPAGVAAGAESLQLLAQLEQADEQTWQPWHFFFHLWQPLQALHALQSLQLLQLWQPFFLNIPFRKQCRGLQQETTAQPLQLETQLEQELQPWPPTVLIAIIRTVLNIGSKPSLFVTD